MNDRHKKCSADAPYNKFSSINEHVLVLAPHASRPFLWHKTSDDWLKSTLVKLGRQSHLTLLVMV